MDWLRRAIGTEPTCSETTFLNSMAKCEEVSDVGILGFEFYFPRNYVSQKDLEKFDNASTGKYTKGLGQTEMVFCADNEDVCSMSLTVTAALLEKYNINQNSIGYLEVGTETLIDKSKSVKTVLMDLFPENTDLAGADVKNACYGGTQALLHAADWVQSNYEFEKKLAIVVSVDIAVYAPGSARCTGGAGAIAFLVGPNAPLIIERGLRAFYARNVYDFYKPVGGQSTEYAIVDGAVSVEAYLTAADVTYETYAQKAKRNFNQEISLQDFHAVLFHSPFSKLTQKALARLAFKDFLSNRSCGDLIDLNSLEKFRNVNKNELFSKDFIAVAIASAQPLFEKKLDPYLEFCRRLGNMYTPSLYAQLINVIYRDGKSNNLNGKKILLFSYGSGCIAAMFSLKCKLETAEQQKYLEKMRQSAESAYNRLDQRYQNTPEEFVRTLKTRETFIANEELYEPPLLVPNLINGNNNHIKISANDNGRVFDAVNCDIVDDNEKCRKRDLFFPGTFYLSRVDERHQRSYTRFLPSK